MNQVNSTCPTLRQLAFEAIIHHEQFIQNDLYFEMASSGDYPALAPIKEIWDSLKDKIFIAFGPNGIIQEIERSLIIECCKKFHISSCFLSPDDKEVMLTNNVRILFQRLHSQLHPSPITIESCRTLQQQWEEEALILMWTKGISPQLQEKGPKLSSVGEIRAWMTDPDNAVILEQITVLQLYNLGIKAIPPEIQNLTHLKTLNLCKNQIRCIPDFIGTLAHLEMLNLNHNQISCIPHSIGCCENLTLLYLGWNKITTLPNEIFLALTNLNQLWLCHNKICYLPNSLLNLDQLYQLDLSGNPLFLYMKLGKDWKGLNIDGKSFLDTRPVAYFLLKVKTLNDYECQGTLSSFFKGIHYALHINRHDLIKAAFNKLSNQDKNLICEAFSILKKYDGIVDDLLFKDMDLFCEAIMRAIHLKYERLSENQKECIYELLVERGFEDHLLLMSDLIAEFVPLSEEESSSIEELKEEEEEIVLPSIHLSEEPETPKKNPCNCQIF